MLKLIHVFFPQVVAFATQFFQYGSNVSLEPKGLQQLVVNGR